MGPAPDLSHRLPHRHPYYHWKDDDYDDDDDDPRPNPSWMMISPIHRRHLVDDDDVDDDRPDLLSAVS